MEFVRKLQLFQLFERYLFPIPVTKLTYLLRDSWRRAFRKTASKRGKTFVAISNLNTGECEMRSNVPLLI